MKTTSLTSTDRVQPHPARSFASVLTDLGHNCNGACLNAVDELRAELWLVRRRLAAAGPGSALVVLDARAYDGSVEGSRQLMRAINDCVRPDGIRVSERRTDDSGLALAMVQSNAHVTPGQRSPTQPQRPMEM